MKDTSALFDERDISIYTSVFKGYLESVEDLRRMKHESDEDTKHSRNTIMNQIEYRLSYLLKEIEKITQR